jgi:hypothetical protein
VKGAGIAFFEELAGALTARCFDLGGIMMSYESARM